ncbi:hypothetical protein KCP70_03530 [Salmonella enterica subsp. enterica]|nr:hypothetical protein KCP70_03530 [Salmonella enterica subsp. enterica]
MTFTHHSSILRCLYDNPITVPNPVTRHPWRRPARQLSSANLFPISPRVHQLPSPISVALLVKT